MKKAYDIKEFVANPEKFYFLSLQSKVSDEDLVALAKELNKNNTLVVVSINEFTLNPIYEFGPIPWYFEREDYYYDSKIINKIKTKVAENKIKLINSVYQKFEKEVLSLPSDIIHEIICYLELDDLALIGRDLFRKGLQNHSQVEINEEVSILGIVANSSDSSDVTTI